MHVLKKWLILKQRPDKSEFTSLLSLPLSYAVDQDWRCLFISDFSVELLSEFFTCGRLTMRTSYVMTIVNLGPSFIGGPFGNVSNSVKWVWQNRCTRSYL